MSDTTVATETPPLPPQDNTNVQQNFLQQQQQQWMYYPQYMSAHQYAQHYYQFWSQHGYDFSSALPRKDEVPINPPLPKGPPPPSSTPSVTNSPQANIPKQFGNIRFNINGKRQLNTPSPFQQNQNNTSNSGAAKKKRKRNRNKQNQMNQLNNSFNQMPPLPPPETNTPKPEPPPELPPMSPPLPAEKPPQNNEITTDNNPAEDWPESLKTYVNQCYAKCKTGIDKNQVDIILKGKILQAYQTGQLNKDWSKEPLPNIFSERSTPLVARPVPGLLAQYQNPIKKGLSPAMGARLGTRTSTLRGKSRSNSRSRSRSPPYRRKSRSRSRSSQRRSSSRSSDSSSDSKSKNDKFKPKNKGKVSDKWGSVKKLSAKQIKRIKNAEKKKAHFYSNFGSEMEENNELLQQRAARFGNSSKNVSSVVNSFNLNPVSQKQGFVIDKFSDENMEFDWTEFHIVGTSKDVEKSFLRLTKAPDCGEIRPVEVLKMSLQNVKDRWKDKRDYFYACDQLKSIRQDLTVQGIRDEFTVEVYETHARIALEKGDHEEFNQCQTQLKMLYSDIGGPHKNEFTAYRILYYIFTKNTLDIMTILKTLSIEEKNDECIKFALKMRSAWGLGNFHRYFKLYIQAPLMSGYLVDWFIERERKSYLKCIIKSYRQNVSISYLMEALAFHAQEDCLAFLEPFGLTYTDLSRTLIDCKSSMSVLQNI